MWGKDQCLKKNAQLKLTEDFSLGYSVSDSSEGQFQRGKGRARIYSSFSEKQTNKNNHVVEHQKFTANHKNRHLMLMTLVLFYVWEHARVWAY